MYIKEQYKESLAKCPLEENNRTVSGDWELRKSFGQTMDVVG